MIPLVSLEAVTKAYGPNPIFERLSFVVAEEDCTILIGVNGSGKSTLLDIITRKTEVDDGRVSWRSDLRMSYVPQQDVFEAEMSVADVLRSVLPPEDPDSPARLSRALTLGGFTSPDQQAELLSGGWRKRLAIVRALVVEPELLILDEPTNHLDLAGVLWLEDLLTKPRFAVLMVTHDRYLIERVGTRVVEVGREYSQGIFAVEGRYSDFLEKRAAHSEAQASYQASLSNRVRREVEWLRAGVRGRGTKAKARIDHAHELIGDLNAIPSERRTAKLEFSGSNRQSKELVVMKGVSKQLGDRKLFEKVSCVIKPTTRLGIVGPNGSGKSTFLKILHGDLAPDTGQVVRASQLKVAYFDQHRGSLNSNDTLKEALCPEGGDGVVFQGRGHHVIAWAKRFLFQPDQLGVRVAELSGGEQARVVLARIMLQTVDLLLLDEPTNDLDIKTLEVLEEGLVDFPGAVVIVTHDRYLLDRVANTLIGLQPDGRAITYADYLQWEAAFREANKVATQAKRLETPRQEKEVEKREPSKKLTYAEQLELGAIEERIMKAEAETGRLQTVLSAGTMVQPDEIRRACEELHTAELQVKTLYTRWEELERKARQ